MGWKIPIGILVVAVTAGSISGAIRADVGMNVAREFWPRHPHRRVTLEHRERFVRSGARAGVSYDRPHDR